MFCIQGGLVFKTTALTNGIYLTHPAQVPGQLAAERAPANDDHLFGRLHTTVGHFQVSDGAQSADAVPHRLWR